MSSQMIELLKAVRLINTTRRIKYLFFDVECYPGKIRYLVVSDRLCLRVLIGEN